jgi:hypothetical protein
LTLLGYIFGKGFFGSGYFDAFTSWQASTQAPHPIHFLISIRVASSPLSAPLTVAGRGRLDAPSAPRAAILPLRKDRRDICVFMPVSFSLFYLRTRIREKVTAKEGRVAGVKDLK